MQFTEELNKMGLSYIKTKKTSNKWEGTPLETYEKLGPKAKGKYGEGVIKAIFESYGFQVEPHKNENDPYDLIVEGIRSEAKFSAATDRNYLNQYTYNHIAMEKDWGRLILCGVNGDLEYKVVWFTKDEVAEIMECESFLKHQQGGKYSKNDDFMCTSSRTTKLMNHPYAKTPDQWLQYK